MSGNGGEAQLTTNNSDTLKPIREEKGRTASVASNDNGAFWSTQNYS
jgi:hypothetical protein